MSASPVCEHCGARCMFHDPDPATDEPCWGEVVPATHRQFEGPGYVEDVFEHICKGHRLDGRYIEQDDEA